MKLGIFAKTFSGDQPNTVLKQCFDAGFPVAQYNMACSGMASMPAVISGSDCTIIRDAALDSNVDLCAISATYNMIHPDLTIRNEGHKKLEVIASAAQKMGIKLLTLCTGTRNAEDQWSKHRDNVSSEAWNDLLSSMEVALQIAEDNKLDLGIEPELANVVDSAVKAKHLLDELQSDRLKIIFDPANLFEKTSLSIQRDIVSRGIDLLAPDLTMAHAKDRFSDGEFATAGMGILDYTHYLRRLHETGFKGPLVAHGLKANEASKVSVFLTEKLREVGVI
ncbi:MAG: sugar phosphate isomerase/epimerase [Hyphomicrobiales bacterium]